MASPKIRKTRTIHKLKPIDVMRLDKGKYCDGAGLWLTKDSKSAGRYVYRYMLGGKAHELGIGGIHTYTLAEARDKARALRKAVKDGADPLRDRKEAKLRSKIEAASMTSFETFALEYIRDHSAAWTNQKHAQQWTQSLNAYVYPLLGAMSVADVDVDAVMTVFRQPVDGTTFWRARPETASRVRGRIEKILDAAKAAGKRKGADENPARSVAILLPARGQVEKGKKKHHPSLPYNNVPSLMEALSAREDIAAKALEFAILTAARVGEVRAATWDEIDLPNKVWTVPATRVKTRQEHRVPLCDRALAILESVKSESPYVFRGRGGVPISDKSVREVLTGIAPGYTVHGFRSSFRTWAAEATEHRSDTCEMALGHKVGSKVEDAYRRTRLFDRRRQLMADWDAFCSGKTATVLEFVRTG